MTAILIVALLIFVGALLMRGVFATKGRNGANGAMLGALLGLFPPALIIGLIIVLIFVPSKARLQERGSHQRGQATATATNKSLQERLEELGELRKQEMVSEEEFSKIRDQILASI